MKNLPAPLWTAPLPLNTEKSLRTILSAYKDTPIFFRADDIGGKTDPLFHPLMELFLTHRIPLCLAVVPTWIDSATWSHYQQYQPQSSQWCWHQHGYSHTNHEQAGKKAEFGRSRTKNEVKQDIVNGKNKLANLLGEAFHPAFTPPWNRCSSHTLETLAEQRFYAVSRSKKAAPLPPAELPDIQINIDLHTRKEQDAATSWEALYAEINQAADSGIMGIMLHHQLMNRQGFAFLDLLLGLVQEYHLPACTFQDMSNEIRSSFFH